jgi:hypothetical protein
MEEIQLFQNFFQIFIGNLPRFSFTVQWIPRSGVQGVQGALPGRLRRVFGRSASHRSLYVTTTQHITHHNYLPYTTCAIFAQSTNNIRQVSTFLSSSTLLKKQTEFAVEVLCLCTCTCKYIHVPPLRLARASCTFHYTGWELTVHFPPLKCRSTADFTRSFTIAKVHP